MNKKKILKFFQLIGIIIFIVIVWFVNPKKIIENFRDMNFFYFLIALAITILTLMLKVLKWNILVKCFGRGYSLIQGINVLLIASFAGVITPGRLGDFLRVFYLKQDKGIAFGKGLSTVIIDRVFDILTLFILSFLGMIFFSFLFKASLGFTYLILFFFVVFLVAILLLTKKRFVTTFARPLFNHFVPERYKSRFKLSFHDFYNGINTLRKNKSKVLLAFVLTVLSWYVIFLEFYFIALSLNMNLSYFFISMVLPMAVLIEIIPISFAGVGTRDATLLFFFAFVNVPSDLTVSFSVGILFANLIFATIGAFLFSHRKVKFF